MLVTRVCDNCGCEFQANSREVERGYARFCSRTCMGLSRRGNWRPNWRGGKESRVCVICGTTFETWPSQKGQCCSKACSIQLILKTKASRAVEKPAPEMVTLTCEWCGRDFQVTEGTARKGQKYCSRDCGSKGGGEKRKGAGNHNYGGGTIERTCEWCGAPFLARKPSSRQRFCSRDCHFARQRSGAPRAGKTGKSEPGKRGGLITRECEYCGATFQAKRCTVNHGQGRFCSQGCSRKWQSGERNGMWLGGLSFEPYDANFTEELKERIRKRDGYVCQLCGEPQNGIAHHVHHIDYDKKHSTPDNLITLCAKCHMKTNFRRTRWERKLTAIMQGKHEWQAVQLELLPQM